MVSFQICLRSLMVSCLFLLSGCLFQGGTSTADSGYSPGAARRGSIAPTISSVTSGSSSGSYGLGEVIPIEVVFDQAVFVVGSPTLTLQTGSADVALQYSSGAGSTTLVFDYVVASGHFISALEVVSADSLSASGGSIQNRAGTDAVLTLPGPGAAGSLSANRTLSIDGALPTVVSIGSSLANGLYGPGQAVPIQVTFDEVVTVTGTPQLTLETGASDAVVDYASGTGSTTLTFTYTVQSGHLSSDLDYASAAALALNGGTIRDGVGNAAILTLPSPGGSGSLGASKSLSVDGVAPTVTNVTSTTANGSLGTGQGVAVQVVFSENVTVTGTPRLTLETGASDAVVDYVSVSGDTALFPYTIASGHTSADLNYVSTSSLALNGGTIRDAAGNAAELTLPGLGAAGALAVNKAIVIDPVSPAVTNVTSAKANSTYGTGEAIAVDVTFDKPVTVTGTPQLTLETGASDAVINFASSAAADTLRFTYTVSANHTSADLDYFSTGALALNGGTIRDALGNDAGLSLASPGAAGSLGANKAIVIDAVAPVVLSVTSTAVNGAYGVGQGITLQVVFSKPVTVSGTPRLFLETGAADVYATFSSVSLDIASFNYTVGSGDTSADLDYVGDSSLSLNGGTIQDAYGNNASLTLPAPGGAGSLGANKDISVSSVSIYPFTVAGADDTGWLGRAVSGAGDVDDDGKADFIVGEPGVGGMGNRIGKAYVYSGATGAVIHTVSGDASGGTQFGLSVGGVGDVDEDGFDDFIVGEPKHPGSGTQQGRVYVFSGATGLALYTITGTEDGAFLGSSVASAGDVDGDEVPDFIVGEPNRDAGGSSRGRATVFSGATGSVIYTKDGAENGALFGSAVSGAGDVNEDGLADFLVGEPNASGGGLANGTAYVYSGATGNVIHTIVGTDNLGTLGSSVSPLGDINGDGKDDFIIGEPLAGGSFRGRVRVYSGADASILFTKLGSSNGANFGQSIAVVGDTNGDSIPEWIVGEPYGDVGGTNRGVAYLYDGALGTELSTAVGQEDGAYLGYAVGGAGDLNSDGKLDFIVGEYFAAEGGTQRGRATAYLAP